MVIEYLTIIKQHTIRILARQEYRLILYKPLTVRSHFIVNLISYLMTWKTKPGDTDHLNANESEWSGLRVEVTTLLLFLKGDLPDENAEQIHQLLEQDELLYNVLEGLSALYDDFGDELEEKLELLTLDQFFEFKSKRKIGFTTNSYNTYAMKTMLYESLDLKPFITSIPKQLGYQEWRNYILLIRDI